MSDATQSLFPDGYRTIVADPPWEQPSGGPANSDGFQPGVKPSRLPYSTMSLGAIIALKYRIQAIREAQHLYLWTTNAHLEDAYALTRIWGYKPSQLLTWCKKPRGLGPGGAFASTTEFCLFAWRGSCEPLSRADTTWFLLPRGSHSAKPEAFLDVVEQVSPGPYLELFARRQRLGWDTWGDEALAHVQISEGDPDEVHPPQSRAERQAELNGPSGSPTSLSEPVLESLVARIEAGELLSDKSMSDREFLAPLLDEDVA